MSTELFLGKQSNSIYTYEEFINWLNTDKVHHYKYLHSNNTLSIFKNLVVGLLSNKTTILLDSSFTEQEVSTLLGGYGRTTERESISFKINSVDDLLDKIRNSKAKIGLYTSGTTGKPKLVKHSITTFLNAIRINHQYDKNIWGLAYNPTHMAGVQVFFQAFMNKNFIVELFGTSNSEVTTRVKNYSITHISATPTFYKLLDTEGIIFNHVKRVTLGGEKSNKKIFEKINLLFPKAKITNIYASTEFGTIFISDGDAFSIRKDILDKVKLEGGQVYVHKSLLGETMEEMTSNWFNTGDKIEILSDSPLLFRFLGRESSIVNIGGYNVFPKEIEEIINSIEGVKISRVFAKKNSLLGNLLMAEVVKMKNSNLTEKEIISMLKNEVQAFKIPRIIKFVNDILLTRTGKIKQ